MPLLGECLVQIPSYFLRTLSTRTPYKTCPRIAMSDFISSLSLFLLVLLAFYPLPLSFPISLPTPGVLPPSVPLVNLCSPLPQPQSSSEITTWTNSASVMIVSSLISLLLSLSTLPTFFVVHLTHYRPPSVHHPSWHSDPLPKPSPLPLSCASPRIAHLLSTLFQSYVSSYSSSRLPPPLSPSHNLYCLFTSLVMTASSILTGSQS